jgi:hypothetical protein
MQKQLKAICAEKILNQAISKGNQKDWEPD